MRISQYGVSKRRRQTLAVAVLALCGMCLQAMPAEVTVSIDKGQTFQTIDGNGVNHYISPWEDCNPFCGEVDLTNFLDSVINVLGLTLHREFINGCNCSSSPGEFQIDGTMRNFCEQALQLRQIARDNDEFYGIIPAIMGAPDYMKENNKCAAGFAGTPEKCPTNTLKEDQYDDFGDFCATWIQTAIDTFGIVPYAFSLQNEPRFCVPYPSVVYQHGQHFASMFKVAAPKVKAVDSSILIYGAENTLHSYPTWEMVLYADAECAPYLDRNALHSYRSDGVSPPDPSRFTGVQPVGGKPLWMSETGLRANADYTAFMWLAEVLHIGYDICGFSAYIHNHMLGDAGFVTRDGLLTPCYWGFAQFWRFVRPGMQRIGASSTDDSVLVTAYMDERVSSMSAVIVNTGHTDHTVHLSISGGDAPPQLDVKRTTESEKFVLVGTVAPTDGIEVPARSVVSLGYNYVGTGVPRDVTPVRRPVRSARAGGAIGGGAGQVRVYDLRGRLVARGAGARAVSGAVSAAAYCVDNGMRRSLLIAR